MRCGGFFNDHFVRVTNCSYDYDYLLHVYCWVWWWNNFENRSTIMATLWARVVSCFLTHGFCCCCFCCCCYYYYYYYYYLRQWSEETFIVCPLNGARVEWVGCTEINDDLWCYVFVYEQLHGQRFPDPLAGFEETKGRDGNDGKGRKKG